MQQTASMQQGLIKYDSRPGGTVIRWLGWLHSHNPTFLLAPSQKSLQCRTRYPPAPDNSQHSITFRSTIHLIDKTSHISQDG